VIVNPFLVGICCLLVTLVYVVVALANPNAADSLAFAYIIAVLTFMAFKNGRSG
jgi:hypothetical protein